MLEVHCTHAPVANLFGTYKDASRKNLLEAFHDAVDLKDECLQLFSLGLISELITSLHEEGIASRDRERRHVDEVLT